MTAVSILNCIERNDYIIVQKDYNRAKNYALKLLSYRQRSEKEIINKLSQKGFNREVISDVINFLKEYKLLDDYKFARQWVEYRLAVRPVGIMALKYELKRFGIDREQIEEILNEIDLETEENLAKELIKKKFSSKNKNLTKEKLAVLLQRRGFSYSTILNVLSDLDKI